MKSPKAPKPLDVSNVTQQANTQNTGNAFQQSAFNRVNQSDQFGNKLDYQQTGTDAQGNPVFSASQQLGETGQQFAGGLGALGQQYFGGANDLLSNPADYSNEATEGRLFDLGSRRLDPMFERQGNALESKLRNQGLDPTSEAYKSAMGDFGQQKNDAYNQLALSGRGQAFNEAVQGRQAQVNDLQSLTAPGMQFGQQAMGPSYVNAPGVNVNNVDVAGLYGQQKNNEYQNYQAKMQQQAGLYSAIGGLGGAALGGLGNYYGARR